MGFRNALITGTCLAGLVLGGAGFSCNRRRTFDYNAVVASFVEEAKSKGDEPSEKEVQELRETAKKYIGEYNKDPVAFRSKHASLLRDYAKNPAAPTYREIVKMGIADEVFQGMADGFNP